MPGNLRRLVTLSESLLYRRLVELSTSNALVGDPLETQRLVSTVNEVAQQASFISATIVRHLPQYTLHDRRHSLNVLAIIEALLPSSTFEQLSPFECALPILSAFTHDLGMALTSQEERAILGAEDGPERRRFLRHRDSYRMELDQIDRLHQRNLSEAKDAIRHIEGKILADYIRATHADGDSGRLGRWLDELVIATNNKLLFHYHGGSYREQLALILASHGHETTWLREELARNAGAAAFFEIFGLGEEVNLAFPGLLLRLGDILDFDSSRTPRILFRNLGLSDECSIREWQKHLSVRGLDIRVTNGSPRILYKARCSHPTHEKTIRDFLDQVDAEISSVAAELRLQNIYTQPQGREYLLYLPSVVERDVRAEGRTRPAYVYHDLRFHLDHGEIRHLLMGEALYEDPSLCLRELVQNALDAVELRRLRLQLQALGGESPEPVDALRTDERLEVAVSWGRDESSRVEFVRVSDNGVGMGTDVLVRFFARIGRSFYRSPDFERERALLLAQNLLFSPISQFGIGVLSCFMIADRIVVRTRAGGVDARPLDIYISGPDSLFWIRDGSFERQGTEITVELKPPYRLGRVKDDDFSALRQSFGLKERSEQQVERYRMLPTRSALTGQDRVDQGEIMPVFHTATAVLWPLHPVMLVPPVGEPLQLDDRFHVDRLTPLIISRLRELAVEWGAQPTAIDDPIWGAWDWVDDAGEGATGSRIRLWFPTERSATSSPGLPNDPEDSRLFRQDELAALVEAQITRDSVDDRSRTLVMVHGMRVREAGLCLKELPIRHGVGSMVWVDLRGKAAPALTANRRAAIPPTNLAQWQDTLTGVFDRMVTALRTGTLRGRQAVEIRRNLLMGFRWHHRLVPYLRDSSSSGEIDLISAVAVSGHRQSDGPPIGAYVGARLYQEHALADPKEKAFLRDPELTRALHRQWRFERGPGKASGDSMQSIWARRLRSDPPPRLEPALVGQMTVELAPGLARDLQHVPSTDRGMLARLFDEHARFAWIQEALGPSLEHSSPLFRLGGLQGVLGGARLIAAAKARIEVAIDVGARPAAVSSCEAPEIVGRMGYDLILPLSAIPLGELQLRCPQWREDRRIRLIGSLPFLAPELEQLWQKHLLTLCALLELPEIYALMPPSRLWATPFEAWQENDKAGCVSALLSLHTGRVVWAAGVSARKEINSVGRPFPIFLRSLSRVEIGGSEAIG